MRWYLSEAILPPSDAPAEGDADKPASFGTATVCSHHTSIKLTSKRKTIVRHVRVGLEPNVEGDNLDGSEWTAILPTTVTITR